MPPSTAATAAAAYPSSVFASGCPRYVPIPREESAILCVSRKWPFAARPANFCAYRVVPSLVADLLMTLLRAVVPGPVSDYFLLRSCSAREAASTPEESYDTASPFRGRKSRPRADCCNTTAPLAIGARPDPRWLLWTPLQNARERFAPPTAAGWQFPRIAGKTALPASHSARDRRQSFVPPRPAA